jgi:hypothetical protein
VLGRRRGDAGPDAADALTALAAPAPGEAEVRLLDEIE